MAWHGFRASRVFVYVNVAPVSGWARTKALQDQCNAFLLRPIPARTHNGLRTDYAGQPSRLRYGYVWHPGILDLERLGISN